MQLARIDVNLLVLLTALLEEEHVGRAAKRVGLSPSAASHALSRLRTIFGDPLFIRAGKKLVPTPRAIELTPSLKQGIHALEAVVAPPRKVDAQLLSRSFRVDATDHIQLVLMRRLDAMLRAEAPHVDVYFQTHQPGTLERLRSGALDISIGVSSNVDPDISSTHLFEDRLVPVVRRQHRALRKQVTLERFAELPHLLVAPTGTSTGFVDRLLAEHGLKRRVARTSSTFLDTAFLVAETDYVVSLPEKLILPLLDLLKLAILPVPITLPSFAISMLWHKRNSTESGHRWFRGAIERAAAATEGRAEPNGRRPRAKPGARSST